MQAVANISDVRALAKRKLPPSVFDYIDGGSFAELTKQANEDDFRKLRFRQKVLRDVSVTSTATTVVGQSLPAPIIVAPTGMGGIAWGGDCELAIARAAAAAKVPYILAMLAICSLEEVTAEVGPVWLQMTMLKDRGLFQSVVDRAITAGSPVLVLTVTSPIPAMHAKLYRSGLSFPPKITAARFVEFARRPRWALRTLLGHKIGLHNFSGSTAEMANIVGQFDTTTSWKDVAWVREIWPRKLIVKGICDPDDAQLALEHGADAIVVSNHGGNMLDEGASTISALPHIVERVAGRLDILLDGGVRSGQDVLKAIALGAKACLLGRAPLYGLAAGGEQGVARVIELIRNELAFSAALTGISDVRAATPAILW